MADEKETVATPPANNAELEALKESVKRLEAKNYELIGKLKNQKEEKTVPDDYDALLSFKQKKDQEYRKAEMIEAIITWTVTGLLMVSGIGALILIAWIING